MGAREGAAPVSPAPGEGWRREGGKRAMRRRGCSLGPAFQLLREPGRFAVKTKQYTLKKKMCDVPNCSISKGTPRRILRPPGGRLLKNRRRVRLHSRLFRLEAGGPGAFQAQSVDAFRGKLASTAHMGGGRGSVLDEKLAVQRC